MLDRMNEHDREGNLIHGCVNAFGIMVLLLVLIGAICWLVDTVTK